mmetsp:Transcript_22789/g.63582  ORF Transcript_22789/g.63582 Transcript_22789/m.63582 type:complete len:93 (-) Transcript_22789:769-1047(-)
MGSVDAPVGNCQVAMNIVVLAIDAINVNQPNSKHTEKRLFPFVIMDDSEKPQDDGTIRTMRSSCIVCWSSSAPLSSIRTNPRRDLTMRQVTW